MKKTIVCMLFALASVSSFADTYRQRHEGPSILKAEAQEPVAAYPESRWGQAPAKVTKEMIYAQHPHLKAFDEAKEKEESKTN